MDSDNSKVKEETLVSKIAKVQKELPDLVLPSMGIIKNDNEVIINGKDYIKSKVVKEDQGCH